MPPRQAWQRHPNGTVNITEFVIAASDPLFAAGVYGQLFGAEWIGRIEGGAALNAGVVSATGPAGIKGKTLAARDVTTRGFLTLPQ